MKVKNLVPRMSTCNLIIDVIRAFIHKFGCERRRLVDGRMRLNYYFVCPTIGKSQPNRAHHQRCAFQLPTKDTMDSIQLGSPSIQSLKATLCSESIPLSRRFRALFSLKHSASLDPPTEDTVPAIQAIAAAFTSPSALLKHELAYCLGQTKNEGSIPFLRARLEDENEDTICRHEAAEALAALCDFNSLSLLRRIRDDGREDVTVRETCDIAVDRLEWEQSRQKSREDLQQR